jgi:hypothetical protein
MDLKLMKNQLKVNGYFTLQKKENRHYLLEKNKKF